MADEILKAYGAPREFDRWLEVVDFDPELGFNPFCWISRRYAESVLTYYLGDFNEWAEKQKKLLPHYERYRKFMQQLDTEEMLKGQVFGL